MMLCLCLGTTQEQSRPTVTIIDQ